MLIVRIDYANLVHMILVYSHIRIKFISVIYVRIILITGYPYNTRVRV